MLTQEQLDERLNYITGSDAAVIAGLSPYKTRAQLWLEKTRRTELEDISEANHIKFGNFMEEGVADWFEHESNKRPDFATPKEMLIHPEHKWMAGNIDFKIIGENAILECKTAMRSDDWGHNQNTIPEHYLLQVAHYCAVGNFDRAYVAVVFTMTREFRWYVYERNLALEAKLIKLESDFYNNHLLADMPPEPVNEKDIMALFGTSIPKPIIATDEVESYVEAYNDFNKQVAGLEEEKRYMRDKIALFMEDHDQLISQRGKPLVSWKSTKPITRFDDKALQKDHPELYTQYLKKHPPTRPFKVLTKGDL